MRAVKNQWLVLVVGLSVGMTGGVLGTLMWNSRTTLPPEGDSVVSPIHENWIHAVGSSTGNDFALATGAIDGDAEGIFALDFVTGDLNVRVLNRNTRTFLGVFKQNVLADLRVDQDKSPKFVMVTGNASLLGGGGAVKPSFCVCYVGDVRSGRVVAYSVPWNKTLSARGVKQTGPLAVLDRFEARIATLQDQP